MDPLCHTFVGAALAGTPLGERTRWALPVLLVSANLPDLDAITYFLDGDTALWFRRGWTHGVLALVLLPLLVTAVTVGIARWRRRAGVRADQVLLLATLGTLSHPFLDWLNTYGMRWLMPFDGRWWYGDLLYIVDPWLWLLLGGAAFLRFSRSWPALAGWVAVGVVTSRLVLTTPAVPVGARVAWLAGLAALALLRWRNRGDEGRRRRAATVGLAAAGGYVVLLALVTPLAARAAAAGAGAAGFAAGEEVFIGPVAADPFARDVLFVSVDGYRPARLTLLPSPRLHPASFLPRGPRDPRISTALAAPCARGMATWMRYPWYRIERSPAGGSVVHLYDARYARAPRPGFGGRRVELDAGGAVVGCR